MCLDQSMTVDIDNCYGKHSSLFIMIVIYTSIVFSFPGSCMDNSTQS